jgi:hypothetical protein
MSESISSTVPAEPVELPQDWFFTFGYDHTHPMTGQRLHKSYVRIHGTCDSTREAMFAVFENRWAFQYSSARKAERIDAYGMTEVAMPAGPCPGGQWCRCPQSTPCRPGAVSE